MRKTLLFNDQWEFRKLPPEGEEISESAANRAEWRAVAIPHDWLIGDATDLYRSGIGCYRKRFTLELAPETRALLRFDGVYMDTSVTVNGVPAGEWKYGYTSFELDVTSMLHAGENELLVRCHFRAPNSRWYSGAGVYRDVWLTLVPEAHIAANGVYIAPIEAGDGFDVRVATDTVAAEGCALRHTALDDRGETVGTLDGDGALHIAHPRRWSIGTPTLYTLRTELTRDGAVIDSVDNRFGLRTTRFDPDGGFFLNGERVRLNGVCEHHDLGCLGAAFHKPAMRRKLLKLRAMGVNALRTSHNPVAPAVLDLCDELGFAVVSEAFDMWLRPKTEFDYARFFDEWCERDVAAWVRRDRNHPCVIMWSIGNEIYDTHIDASAVDTTKRLTRYVRAHDPLGNARVTIGSNYMPWEGAQKCADVYKLVGYNYAESYYAPHHAAHPDWAIYGSETASLVYSRGVYHFPLCQPLLTDEDEQCSALGNSRTSWGAKSVERCILDDRQTPFSMGQFIWTGFDYIGEPTPYATKNSYFGQLDTAGFPKDSYYVFQSAWTTAPMAHLYPSWDFSDGQTIDVCGCSTGAAVELFLDGESQGRQALDHQNGPLIAAWQLPYRPGVLTLIAYDESGAEIARDERRSFGDAAATVLAADKTALLADGRDMAFVEISAVDANGAPVENANHRVRVAVEGAARLIGLDNGDSTDYDSYKGTSRRLFSGKLLAVVISDGTAGDARVTVSSAGLPDASLTLHFAPAAIVPGTAIEPANAESPITNELPARKLALSIDGDRALTPARPSVNVTCTLLPANASYADVTWRVVNDAGIDTNLATVEPHGLRATVRALGDGAFRVRCGIRNGKAKTALYAQLECAATGFGAVTLDPYAFVTGGLYTLSHGDVGTGNELGFSSDREGESWVSFANVDFGDFGSDELTVPIFELDNRPFAFEVWQGEPHAPGAERLGAFVYDKPSIWNTYQAETFRLDRRVRGIVTLSFAFHRKAHVKGFQFARQSKAFSRLTARDLERVSGDRYRVEGERVLDVGNNVSLEFGRMDFTPAATALTLEGYTPLDAVTVQLRLTADDGAQTLRMLTFAHACETAPQTFALDPVEGARSVALVFLPGSRFDFAGLRFAAE